MVRGACDSTRVEAGSLSGDRVTATMAGAPDQFGSITEIILGRQGWALNDTSPVTGDQSAIMLAQLLDPRLGHDAVMVARAMLAEFGSLTAVLNAEQDRLAGIASAGLLNASRIIAAKAVFSRAIEEPIRQRRSIGSPDELKDYLIFSMGHLPTEMVRTLYLDRKNGLIANEIVERGTAAAAPLSIRKIVRRALILEASAVILVHNHPSGDLTPSATDRISTRSLATALASVDVVLHDHVIVGHTNILSLRTMGWFNN